MYYIILFISLLLLINFYFKIADYFNIIDKPNHRSSHKEITIRGGGIIFTIGAIGWFISSSFQFPYNNVIPSRFFGIVFYNHTIWFMLGLLLITIVSFIDDLKTVSRSVRFAVHFVAVMLMLYQLQSFHADGIFWKCLFYNHANIQSFHLLQSFHPFGIYWIIISLIVCIGIINAYNFMDGINGITGGYSLAVLAGLWMANNDVIGFVDNRLIYSVAIALMVFNVYNFRVKARCFAGDVGSVSIAFILIFLLGKLILTSGNLMYLFFLTLYGVDSVLTIIHRIYLKENIFDAHRKHFYQILANEGGVSQLKISIGYTITQTLINIMIVLLVDRLSTTYMILSIIGLLLGLTIVYIGVKRKFHLLYR